MWGWFFSIIVCRCGEDPEAPRGGSWSLFLFKQQREERWRGDCRPPFPALVVFLSRGCRPGPGYHRAHCFPRFGLMLVPEGASCPLRGSAPDALGIFWFNVHCSDFSSASRFGILLRCEFASELVCASR